MNTNESNRRDAREAVIELGVVSVETLGDDFDTGEIMGRAVPIGISEE